MTEALACPHCGLASPAFRTLSDALISVSEEMAVEPVLHKLVDAARGLTGARYAALGIPDGAGGFAQFFTSGMSDELWDAIGPLPRTHGLLGAMLAETVPYRTPNIEADPRFEGWPDNHPEMRAFLGVPILSAGEVIAAFYLTDKEDAPQFSAADQQTIEMLAAHAAITIENARLYERSRELSIAEERNRLARDLHDSVTQQLFGIALTAEAATLELDHDLAAARRHLRDLQAVARASAQEMRALVFELRPAELEADGLIATLRKHIDVLRRARGLRLNFRATGERQLPNHVEREVYFITQEALNNALRHSQATSMTVEVQLGKSRLRLLVEDNGLGFDVTDARNRNRRLGITSMEERARSIRGNLRIESSAGAGTRVRLEVPLG